MADYFVIIDGMPDAPCLDRERLFPAGMPFLRELACSSSTGFFTTCPPGFSPDSLCCIGTLLGVPPKELPLGRAWLEAQAAGVPLDELKAACRCNIIEVSRQGRILFSGGGALTDAQMERAAQKAERWLGAQRFLPLGGYKNLLFFPLEWGLPQLAAPHERQGDFWRDCLPQGAPAARELTRIIEESRGILGEFQRASREYLLWPWGASLPQRMPEFSRLHSLDSGFSAGCVCETQLVKGMAAGMGMLTPSIPGATADTDTDLCAKLHMALRLAQRCELIILHINGADEAAHRKNPQEKAAFLQCVDSILLRGLWERLSPGDRLLVTSDHGTNPVSGRHEAFHQPFVLAGAGAHSAHLGVLEAAQAVPLLLGRETIGPVGVGTP